MDEYGDQLSQPVTTQGLETATFAGGCFWCLEADFASLPGVEQAVSGYTGGAQPNPSYEEVCTGETGHLEAVQVRFDPERISYAMLLNWFWRHIDPTNDKGQFCDAGPQYRTAIFAHNAAQRQQAEQSKAVLDASGALPGPVVTRILAAGPFYPAEGHHQDYHRKNPRRYQLYRVGCGRDETLRRLWGEPRPLFGPPAEGWQKPCAQELRQLLAPLALRVTQESGTEPPFDNAYWDNHAEGIYVDVVSGEPLFGSPDKFDSGTGWPSFSRPLEGVRLAEVRDTKLLAPRTEVRSPLADSHLGHVFADGPGPEGLRYCINSASLRFVPHAEMARQGYGAWLKIFI